MKDRTFSSLPASHQRLVHLMQQLDFGRIEQLHVRNGEPVFDPLPRVVADVKFGADNSLSAKPNTGDFALKQQVVELVAKMSDVGTGIIESLGVRHGLPFSMSVELATLSACALS